MKEYVSTHSLHEFTIAALQTQNLKTTPIYHRIVSLDQESRHSLAGVLRSRSSLGVN